MEYNEAFVDYETLLIDAAKKGFFKKDYSLLYMFFLKRMGVEYADRWFEENTKNEKRIFCANVILKYETDKVIIEKVKAFLDKINKKK